jgi:hypothetical protein
MNTKEFKQLLKALHVPSSADYCSNVTTHRASWTKTGGYAGAKVIDRVRQELRAQDYQMNDYLPTGNPDGSQVGKCTTYVKDGVSVTLDASYGETKDRNRFYISVKAVQVA